MLRTEALKRAAASPAAHLATLRPDGRPHLVVVTFAITSDTFVTAIDHKPKRTDRLQRLKNVESNPAASILIDHYDDDWRELWWVRIDGSARVVLDGGLYDTGHHALIAKYPQYRELPPRGPMVAVTIEDVTAWESTP